MPITPFHFGPGAALHVLAPRHIGFLPFCAANVLIDLESLYNLIQRNWPVHAFLHTWIGAALVAAATIGLFLAAQRLGFCKALTRRGLVAGAALGAFTHLVFDGIMHADMAPFAPFSNANPLLALIAIDRLHQLCLAAAAFALAVLAWRRWRARD